MYSRETIDAAIATIMCSYSTCEDCRKALGIQQNDCPRDHCTREELNNFALDLLRKIERKDYSPWAEISIDDIVSMITTAN